MVAVVALVALVAVAALPPIERPEAVPVKFVATPLDGVPSAPLNVTNAPAEPTATPKAVATLVPSPDTPVDIGRPVQEVKVPEEGVPKTGVTKVGDVLNTLLPEPVDVVTPVPPLATAKVPATVTAPEVAVAGVNPVDPKLIVLTAVVVDSDEKY